MIWCVEDDASIRDIELYALRSAGLEAEGFTDGAAFWKALQSEKPDLVVLDVMLPGIDGTELLGRMRASTSLRRIPVIMATAKGAEYDRVRALDGGADDYLTKPFSVIELVSRVKAVLRRCQPGGGQLHPPQRRGVAGYPCPHRPVRRRTRRPDLQGIRAAAPVPQPPRARPTPATG